MNDSPNEATDAEASGRAGTDPNAAGLEDATRGTDVPTDPAQDRAVDPSTEAAAPPPADDLAPGVPRLGRPTGTSQQIPETILGPRPSPVFLAVLAIGSLAADVVTKLWAEKRLEGYPGYVNVMEEHLMFVLAKNKGGAWGLLQGQSENVRRPFFLLVSVAAIAFIVTLYRRLQPRQHALKWGLPLVLGGALGNVFDRIRYGYVIDFIDYRAEWVRKMNELIAKRSEGHVVTDHWPTFNIADVAICVGVGLMAIDMLTSSRRTRKIAEADVPLEPETLGPPSETAVEESAAAAEAQTPALVETLGETPEPAAEKSSV